MVSTRIIIAIGTFIILLGFGFGWITFTSNFGGYTYFDLASNIGSTYGVCKCPPTADTIQGEFLLLLLPILVSLGPLMASMVLYPVAFVLASYSFFRWKVMWMAGTLSVFASLLWFVGVSLSSETIVRGLEEWSGSVASGETYSVSVQLGPYSALIGGAILLLGYILSRMDRLEWPLD